MTIPLPPLPVPADYQILVLGERWTHCTRMIHDAAAKRDPSTARVLHTADQLREAQREAMRVALEAAARECEARQTPGTGSVAILNGAADAIRNLEIGT